VQVATVETRVDVVVVAFNSGAQLRDCVEPLSREPAIRVVVVDNASTDGGVAAVQHLPVGGGCNVGWRTAAAPYVLFLNPDARLPPEAVLRLADVMERTSAGAVAPRIVDPSGNLEWSVRRFPAVRSIYGQAIFAHRLFPSAEWADEPVRDPERYQREAPCDWASGACLLVRREMLEQIGGFDDGFFMYCEDVDLCRRLWDRGSSVVYTPTVVCTHAGGASSPRWRLMQVLARSRIRYAQKHFDRGRAIAYRSGVVVNEFTHVLVGRGLRGRLGHALALVAAVSRPRSTSARPREH
jgi:N-acetylglucosaminyl-diphospho-decaprenol L-rhamnosyltransferase